METGRDGSGLGEGPTGKALCLDSGRGGCDAQMHMLAITSGLKVVRHRAGDGRIDPEGITHIFTTGPERIGSAIAARTMLGAPIVGLGNPGHRSQELDLVVTTPQFAVAGANVVHLPLAISPHGDCSQGAIGPDTDMLSRLKGPVGLLLVGGDAGPWSMDAEPVLKAIDDMRREAGTTLILTSRRTPVWITERLKDLRHENVIVDKHEATPIGIAAAMHRASWMAVTGDSVSMISEAAVTGKKVSILIPHGDDRAIARHLQDMERDPNGHPMPGDLRLFWKRMAAFGPLNLRRRRHTGRDPLHIAVRAVTLLAARHAKAA